MGAGKYRCFWGDPDNVTIFGQSAGGVSFIHLSYRLQEACFIKQLVNQGRTRRVLTGRPINKENSDALYPVSAETIGINFARKHGIEGTDAEALAKLRALSVEEIVDGGQENDGENGPRIYSGPILDGKFVVTTAESAYNAGRFAKVPLMIGSNSAEIGGEFVNSSKSKEELFSMFGELKNEAKAAYDPNGDKEFAEIITLFNTDWVWGEPARFTARKFVANAQPVYIYQYGYVPPSMKEWMRFGAGHGAEVPFVFGNVVNRDGSSVDAESEKLATIMNTYWANFAKTGNPNSQELANWPIYNEKADCILDIQPDGNLVGKPTQEKLDLMLLRKLLNIENAYKRVEVFNHESI